MSVPTSVEPSLVVQDLRVTFGEVEAVSNVTLSVPRQGRVAIIGESGSGKSVTAAAITNLVHFQGGRVDPASSIRFEGEELVGAPEQRLRSLRGSGIGVVFQDHGSALNPVQTIGRQLLESLSVGEVTLGKAAARERALLLLEQVGLDQPARRFDQYPHELSGGMRQRVLIALAIAPAPRLLIADEPTTALDALVQRQIIELLARLSDDSDMSVLIISHDLRMVAEFAQETYVMLEGRVVERGPTDTLLGSPQHQYTQILVSAAQGHFVRGAAEPVPAAGPEVSSGTAVGVRTRPTLVGPAPHESLPEPEGARPLLQVTDLQYSYEGRRKKARLAVKGVSFDISRATSFGLIGESGSGKSTVARCVARLLRPTSGAVAFAGTDVSAASYRRLRGFRQEVQVVFQDPRASLDPRMRVHQLLAEPLRIHGLWKDGGDRQQLVEALEAVDLTARDLDKFPAHFSGGQLQRIAIARALILKPRLVICDEAVSSLDASVASRVMKLLADLKSSHNLTYLFITHDLGLVRDFCDDIAVMRQGRIVERGSAAAIFDAPEHPYTRQLLSAQVLT